MTHLPLVAAKVVTMLIGLLIALQAYRGYRRNASRPMLFLAIGFSLISVGFAVQGVLFEFVGFSLAQAGAVQTVIVAVGMGSILYSLYGDVTG